MDVYRRWCGAFLLAVGIPYWLTHRRLRPQEHVDADTYLKARDQAVEDVPLQQPAHSARLVSAGTQPIGQPKTRTTLGKRATAAARRKRTGGASPKSRTELYKIAQQRDLPGRSKMGRDELARELGER